MKYIGFELLWYDAWVGFFYDQKKRILYFCPLPCFVFKWQAVEHRVQADGDYCTCLNTAPDAIDITHFCMACQRPRR